MEEIKTSCRFLKFTDIKFLNSDDTPLQGDHIRFFKNENGTDELMVIMRFRNGYLNSNNNLPAIECGDTHCEYWDMGKLHNEQFDINGDPMPAIFSDYGKIREFWKHGKQISVETV